MDKSLAYLTARFLEAIDAQTALEHRQAAERQELLAKLQRLDQYLGEAKELADKAMVARQEYLGRLLTPWQRHPENSWGYGRPSASIFRHGSNSPICEIRCIQMIPSGGGESYITWQRTVWARVKGSYDGTERLTRPSENPTQDLEAHIQDAGRLLVDLGWIIPEE